MLHVNNRVHGSPICRLLYMYHLQETYSSVPQASLTGLLGITKRLDSHLMTYPQTLYASLDPNAGEEVNFTELGTTTLLKDRCFTQPTSHVGLSTPMDIFEDGFSKLRNLNAPVCARGVTSDA